MKLQIEPFKILKGYYKIQMQSLANKSFLTFDPQPYKKLGLPLRLEIGIYLSMVCSFRIPGKERQIDFFGLFKQVLLPKFTKRLLFVLFNLISLTIMFRKETVFIQSRNGLSCD